MHTPPFRKEIFDILFSPRALHHTGNMELALDRLIPSIKKGGILAYSVYSNENNFLMWGIIEPVKRFANKFVPRLVLLGISSLLTLLVVAIIRFLYVPLDRLNLKFLPLHNFFMVWSKLSFKTIKIGIFDLLHAPFAEYVSDKQIKEWEKEFKLKPIQQELLHDTVWGYSAYKNT
jgi:hypothetical protein